MEIEAEQIRYLGDVQRLSLQPGDVIVLSVQEQLSVDAMIGIRRIVESAIPGHKCLILAPGMKIGAVAGRQ
jgi:hypothetical protein